MSDLWWMLLKYQTSLPQFDPNLDYTTGYAGVPPVQMASAQHPRHYKEYLQGKYPSQFWAFEGKDASVQHGASAHRSDDEGTFLDVGVRSFEPIGSEQKVGRMATPDEMPDKRNIVVRRRSAADHPRHIRNIDKEIRRRNAERERRLKLRSRELGGMKPMDFLRRRDLKMLKEAKSPKALAHKRKYETQYESSPARKKYRRELERERRKRGVAGKGGKDMSHTKRGTIVPEDPHANRARSHPSVGSTLKMVITKEAPLGCIRCGRRSKLTRINDEGGYNICTDCYMGMILDEGRKLSQQRQAQQAHDSRYDTMMYHGEPMDIAMRLLKEQKKLFVQGQKTLDGRPAFTPTDFAAEEQRRQAALKEKQAREAREAQRRKAAEGNTTLPQFQPSSE